MTHPKMNSTTWLREHWFELLLAIVVLTAISISPTSLRAEEKDLPSGEQILDDYLKATGGKKVRKKLTNRVTVASLNLEAQGIQLNMTIHSAPPNRNYTVVESEFTGKIEKGSDGNVVWEISDMMGPQVKDGQERADFLREAHFDRFADWREIYSGTECAGIESVEDHAAYKVLMKPKSGKEQAMYFDTKSNLLVKHEFVIENAMGSIPVTSYISDYRKVDGVLMPFEIRAVVMGQERLLTTVSIEHNVDLPSGQFELPQAIQSLVGDSETTSDKKG